MRTVFWRFLDGFALGCGLFCERRDGWSIGLGLTGARALDWQRVNVVLGWGWDDDVPLRPWPQLWEKSKVGRPHTAVAAFCGLFVRLDWHPGRQVENSIGQAALSVLASCAVGLLTFLLTFLSIAAATLLLGLLHA